MEQQGTCGLDFEGGPGNCGVVVARLRGRHRGVHAHRAADRARHRPDARRAAPGRRGERLMALGGRRRASTAADLQAVLAALCSTPIRSCSTPGQSWRRGRGAARDSPPATALERFCAWWSARIRCSSQQHYVETFDLHKRSGLYLTFYGEGDKRERGVGAAAPQAPVPRRRTAARRHRAARLPAGDARVRRRRAARPRRDRAARAPRGAGAGAPQPARARDSPTPTCSTRSASRSASISAADRARTIKLAAAGPPQELVGLEPFAPPEVMPSAEARR